MIKKVLVIISGGLDSTTLLYVTKKILNLDCEAITYNYGQRHIKEISFAKYHTKLLKVPHHIVDISNIYRPIAKSSALLGGSEVPTIQEVSKDVQPITTVPFRNLLLLTIAGAYAEALNCSHIFYGAQKHDEYYGYWDTTLSFVEKVNSVFNENRKFKIRIIAPFVTLSKSHIIKLGSYLGVDYSKTISCYNGTIPYCGMCPTDYDRMVCFAKAGLVDPGKYKIDIDWNDLINKHLNYSVVKMTLDNLVEEVTKNIKV
ncbi:MAG: 7-cyano-7-deazaguanine synthase QueC [Candidatus Odinarchaeia archaeon]